MCKLALLAAIGLSPLFAQAASEVESLAWMAGNWSGPVGRGHGEEIWIAPKAGVMLGMSRTIRQDKMIAFEFLRIEKRPDGIYYVAQPGGRPPTDFKLTQSTEALAVFENPKHDYPKVITYRLEGGTTLVATTEGSSAQPKKQEFRFQRLADAVKP